MHFPKREKILFKVLENSRVDILKYLIEKQNYTPNIKNKYGETLLFAAANNICFNKEDFIILKYLLDKCGLKQEELLSLMLNFKDKPEVIKLFVEKFTKQQNFM